ncbi:MAG: hypothetical protein OHK003_25790 [Anaerolineales bacterium]
MASGTLVAALIGVAIGILSHDWIWIAFGIPLGLAIGFGIGAARAFGIHAKKDKDATGNKN